MPSRIVPNADHQPYERALKYYRRALKIDPWHDEAFYRLGLAQYRNGHLIEADLSFANAVNTNPKHLAAQDLMKEIQRKLTRKPKKKNRPFQTDLFPHVEPKA